MKTKTFTALPKSERRTIETEFAKAVYASVVKLFKREEAAGHIIGNGHHAAQNAASAVIVDLKSRWYEDPAPQLPTAERIAQAEREIEDEDRRERAGRYGECKAGTESHRRSNLPSEHPDHICGLMCDGQDGPSSYCGRLRMKLFGKRSRG